MMCGAQNNMCFLTLLEATPTLNVLQCMCLFVCMPQGAEACAAQY